MSETFTGKVTITDANGRVVFAFDAGFALLDVGSKGNEGDVRTLDDAGSVAIHLDGGQHLLRVFNDKNQATIELNGNQGDIHLRGADCAEYFDVADDSANAGPGTVMTLGDDGHIRDARCAYDTRVAGVVPGAQMSRPGVVLGAPSGTTARALVALAGTTYCKVDAEYAAVRVGDLLTTSPTLYHRSGTHGRGRRRQHCTDAEERLRLRCQSLH